MASWYGMCAPFKASLSYPPKPLLLKTILLYVELEAKVQMYLFGNNTELRHLKGPKKDQTLSEIFDTLRRSKKM